MVLYLFTSTLAGPMLAPLFVKISFFENFFDTCTNFFEILCADLLKNQLAKGPDQGSRMALPLWAARNDRHK
jgi:hypothetical protein